jgi:hypothetical protein
MAGIQFDPNAGGAQGPRETIAGHTFNAGQSAVINECKDKVAGLVKERNNAAEHMPERAVQINGEIEQFLGAEVEGKLKNAGLNKAEIKDVIQHFKETTGYKDLPDNLSKIDSSDLRREEPSIFAGLNSNNKAIVMELMQDLTAKLDDLESRVKQCKTQEMKERVYDEGKREIFQTSVRSDRVQENLINQGVLSFSENDIKVAVNCLTQVFGDKTREIRQFKETTGYNDLPANLSKIDSSVSRGEEPPAFSRLDRDKQPVVRELMQDLTAKLNALDSRVKQCETQEMKERVYNEGRAEIFPAILPGQVEKNLLDKGVASFTDDEILITVECLGQVLADKTLEIREKYGIRY